MEQFIKQIQDYADACGCSPSTALQRTGLASGSSWRLWSGRISSPTLKTADAILAYFAANPAPAVDADGDDKEVAA